MIHIGTPYTSWGRFGEVGEGRGAEGGLEGLDGGKGVFALVSTE